MDPGSQITPERDWILAVFRLPLKTARCAAAKAVPVRIDSALAHGVTRGLDPRVHLLRKTLLRKKMDCRVKPGNDGGEAVAAILRPFEREQL